MPYDSVKRSGLYRLPKGGVGKISLILTGMNMSAYGSTIEHITGLDQGRRKHFRIGQAIKCFRSLCSRILLISSTLTRLLRFMISKCRQPGK